MKNKPIFITIILALTFQFNTATSQVQELPPDTTISFVFSQNLGYGESFNIPTGDLDSDGDSDVVVINYQRLSRVWFNDGHGVFTGSQQLGSLSGHGGALGDLDGDEDLDLFLVHNMTYDRIFLNDGSGVFTATSQELGNEDDYGIHVVLGDIDNDDDLDALVENYLHHNRVWTNDGNGYFTDSGQSLGDTNAVAMVLGDLDSDNDLDVFVINDDQHDRVWFNDGLGNFTDSGQMLDSLGGWGKVDLGDLDGDEDLDAFVTNTEHGSKVWFNDGSGNFTVGGYFFGDSSQKVKLGDMDLDGSLDAVTTHYQLGNLVWLNDGTGYFPYPGIDYGGSEGIGVSLCDVDLDGDLDIFLGNGTYYGGSGYVDLYLNESMTGINETPPVRSVHQFKLAQNYPNPFNPMTRIGYELIKPVKVTLRIYDMRGREVKTLINEDQTAGPKFVLWDGRDNWGNPVSSGVYIYRIQMGDSAIPVSRKMILIR
jgi:hypothetical protein